MGLWELLWGCWFGGLCRKRKHYVNLKELLNLGGLCAKGKDGERENRERTGTKESSDDRSYLLMTCGLRGEKELELVD